MSLSEIQPFGGNPLAEVLVRLQVEVGNDIDSIVDDELLGTAIEDWCAHVVSKHVVSAPLVRFDDATSDYEQGQRLVQIADGQPALAPAVWYKLRVPFDGDWHLLLLRPAASISGGPPRGMIRDACIELTVCEPNIEPDVVRRRLDDALGRLRFYVDAMTKEVEAHNALLDATVRTKLASKKDRALRIRGILDALPYPLRRRDDQPAVLAVPVTRKSIIPRPEASGDRSSPEWAITIGQYDDVLRCLQDMAAVIERSPKAFANMDEEALRFLFLVPLNAQFQGGATGETFNFEGKTDILIRHQGKNVFIAECKVWHGPKTLTDAVDQLLGYVTWRDTKTAILLFNRGGSLTTVLDTIPEAVEKHLNFKRKQEYRSETGFRFVLRHRDDTSREIILTVLVFDVPASD